MPRNARPWLHLEVWYLKGQDDPILIRLLRERGEALKYCKH
jgi:hypothetical protein